MFDPYVRSILISPMAFFALLGCGAPPDHVLFRPALCGVAGPKTGKTCSSMADCGGSMNVHRVSFCEHCAASAIASVCEAGTCRPLDLSGRIRVVFTPPEVARGAQSYTLAILDPIAADGVRLSCAALLTPACPFSATSANSAPISLNASNSDWDNFPQGGAVPGTVYTRAGSADVGTERLVVVHFVSEPQGRGEVRASLCVPGVEVKSGQTTEVAPLDP